MDKNDFLKLDKILVGIDLEKYLLAPFTITVSQKSISELGNFYHPWYHLGNKIIGYEEARDNEYEFRDLGIKLNDTDLVDLNVQRKQKIVQLKFGPLHPIPVATDLNAGITVILDSNHTLSNLYRKYLVAKADCMVPIAELSGNNLEEVFYDFKVFNKEIVLNA